MWLKRVPREMETLCLLQSGRQTEVAETSSFQFNFALRSQLRTKIHSLGHATAHKQFSRPKICGNRKLSLNRQPFPTDVVVSQCSTSGESHNVSKEFILARKLSFSRPTQLHTQQWLFQSLRADAVSRKDDLPVDTYLAEYLDELLVVEVIHGFHNTRQEKLEQKVNISLVAI